MMRKFFWVGVFLFCSAAASRAGMIPSFIDWETSLQWSSYGYADLRQSSVNDKAGADNQASWNNVFKWKDQEGLSVTADARWRFEAFHGGMDNHSRGAVHFRDLYVDLKGDQYDFSVGQKRVTWGKMDEVVILDRISPQDFRYFVLYDKQERKEPALMVHHQWFGSEDFSVEAVLLPFFQPSEIDFFGTNWAVFGHLQQAVSESPVYSLAQKDVVSGIAIQDDQGVTSRSLKNAQAALRVRGRAGSADYGIYYLNLYHSVPVLREVNSAGNLTKQFLFEPTAQHLDALVASGASGDDLRLVKTHPRVHAVGTDWETVWEDFGVRGEIAFFRGIPYLKEDFAFTQKNQLAFGVGIDHTTADQWYVDLQYVQEYVLNHEPLYGANEAPVSFSGTVSKDLLRGVFVASLDWVWQVTYGDMMMNPEVVYKWERAQTDIALGLFVFEGRNQKSLFGRYQNNDVVYIKVSGRF